ncbi:hypothetical protein CGI93_22320 [Vibrio parahaemolyticus]|uniref:hypothetical protein n=1 Tax=Vibrio parahaemolyticus TaxID=670 RepID=UPI0011246B07|nr:hypothetical protein [Vibrio parahaemolyticus]TOG81111.1 hypothetical protein CGI93_22320 [Vibrio parahaemolyticus]HCK0617622.1 hypothetical protein [Vibrio parahaemolyticus]
MKKLKLLLTLSLISFQSIAGFTMDLTDPQYLNVADMYPSYEMLRSLNFNDNDGKMSLFGFKTDKNSDSWDTIFAATISSNRDGKQKIYITLASTCDNTEEVLEKTTIKTNGQNVRYHRFCDGTHIYMTPISKAGDNFLVNEFKKKDSVKFEFSDIVVLFDATGFTKGWNNYGGDAL